MESVLAVRCPDLDQLPARSRSHGLRDGPHGAAALGRGKSKLAEILTFTDNEEDVRPSSSARQQAFDAALDVSATS